jgi:hypothetical protein
MQGRIRRQVTYANVAGSLAMVAVAVVGCAPPAEKRASCPARFDTAKWRHAELDSPLRLKLAQQVVRCRFVRFNFSKRRVAAVLGRAEPLGSQTREDYRLEWDYYVGVTHPAIGPADDRVLSVSFGSGNVVEGISIEPPIR